MIVNFAERAHNHNWELDPVVRSLLDTDFYKLLMLQFIWKHFPKTRVQFSLINRHASVRMADIINIEELKVQLQQQAEDAWGQEHLRMLVSKARVDIKDPVMLGMYQQLEAYRAAQAAAASQPATAPAPK